MSFITDFMGGGKANTSALDKKQQALVDREKALYDSLLANYQTNARGGSYDPNAQLDLLKNDNAYASKISTGNAAAAARTMGYKPGDSEPLLAQAAIGRKSELAYADAANSIRNNATDRGSQALGQVAGIGGGLLSNGIGAYDSMIQRKVQEASRPSGFASLLSAATPFLMGAATGGASFALPGMGRGNVGSGQSGFLGGNRPGQFAHF